MWFFFFFNDTATTEIYTLSLHDALPICGLQRLLHEGVAEAHPMLAPGELVEVPEDRKSTRLNSSHDQISYAVFCLKKKKKTDSTSKSWEISRSLLLYIACILAQISRALP